MKKFFLTVLLMPFIISSCSNDPSIEETITMEPGKGAIRFTSTVELPDVSFTRSSEVDISNFFISLQNLRDYSKIEGYYHEFTGGVINNLEPGEYYLSITSHPNGFNAGFDDPWYDGFILNIAVEAGKVSNASVVCTQRNSALYFVYDSSLDNVYPNLVPFVKQGVWADPLVYEGEHKHSVGYFWDSTVEIWLENDGQSILIEGAETKTFPLKKGELWEITLKVNQDIDPTLGIVSVDIDVKVNDEPTNREEVDLSIQQIDMGYIKMTVLEKDYNTIKINYKTFDGYQITEGKYCLVDRVGFDYYLNDWKLTIEEILETWMRADPLPDHYITGMNSGAGYTIEWEGLSPGQEAYAIVVATVDGVEQVSRLKVSAKSIEDGPVSNAWYYTSFYDTFDSLKGEFHTGYRTLCAVRATGLDNLYTFSNAFRFSDLMLIADYEETSNSLVFNGYEAVGSRPVINSTQGLAFAFEDEPETYYSAGIFIYHKDDLTRVDPLVLYLDDQTRLTTNEHIISLDLYEFGSENPSDFIMNLEVIPAGHEFVYSHRANPNPWLAPMPQSSARKGKLMLMGDDGRPVVKERHVILN